MALSGILETVREDDFVEYYIFPKITGNNENEESTHVSLNSYLAKVNDIINKYSSAYLWHKDSFNIVSRTENSQMLADEEFNSKEWLPPHFYGIVHYGDNIEDEWFIVFLLMQLTREIDDLTVRVVDNDGEFLLIEAANHLPAWANPETCEKRTYLYKGQVHMIHPNESKREDSIEVSEALQIIRSKPLKTEAPTNIQKTILDRINEYPGKIKENLHRTNLYLPVGVAAILAAKPNLIAPAVLAFCNRDPIDMKACRAMKYFPPENRVCSSILFTKCLYAMIKHSNYNPDRRTGWNLPDPKSSQYKAHSLGVKIACGFEILVAQAKPSADLENDKSWHQYLKCLKDKNYFNNLLEHSEEYNNLLNKAKDYFKEHKSAAHSTPIIGQEILDLYRNLEYSIDDFKKKESSLPDDDDESWLNINPEELDKMLADRYGQNKFFSLNGCTNASNLTEKLSEFLDHVSSVDGAEFPEIKINACPAENGDSPPVRPQRGIKRNNKEKTTKVSFSKDTKTESANPDAKINFDPLNFSCAVQNILDLVIPDDSWDLESGSEMSEYGDESDMDLENIDPSKTNKKIKEYMEEMDRELAGTTIGKSFEKKHNESDAFDDIENFEPVDIDMNALKNILESYQSQMGAAGPASNMLGPMGVHLEPSSSQKAD